jgi:Uma2 family endonuclease
MDAALKTEFLSVGEYFAEEELSQVRHEYVDGLIYAMAGGTRDHNAISINLLVAMGTHLRGGKCRLSATDLKLHLTIRDADIFYYPDLMVTCDPRDVHPLFNEYPKLIIEILSESTQRVDRIEKLNAYATIETLEEYALVSQTKSEITIFRRANDWQPEFISSLQETLELSSLNLRIPLTEVYRGVL